MGDVEPDMTPTATHLAAAVDERALLDRARAGDADAFVALVRRHDRQLRGLVYRLTNDAHLMDDILQEVYLRAYKAVGSFREDAAVATWLHRIAYNACLDELRRRGRRDEVPIEFAGERPDRDPDPGEVVALRGDLAAALDLLPLDQRAAVLLVDLHGFDYDTAAEILGVARGTVGSRVSRSRAVLRRALSPDAPTPGETR